MSVFKVFLVRIFPHSDWIRRERIQSECGKIRTRKTPNTDTFHAVSMLQLNPFLANVPILYPLKTENQRWGYKMGTIVRSGLRQENTEQKKVVFQSCLDIVSELSLRFSRILNFKRTPVQKKASQELPHCTKNKVFLQKLLY